MEEPNFQNIKRRSPRQPLVKFSLKSFSHLQPVNELEEDKDEDDEIACKIIESVEEMEINNLEASVDESDSHSDNKE